MGSAEASHRSAAARTIPTTPGPQTAAGSLLRPADSSAWPMTAEIWSAMWSGHPAGGVAAGWPVEQRGVTTNR